MVKKKQTIAVLQVRTVDVYNGEKSDDCSTILEAYSSLKEALDSLEEEYKTEISEREFAGDTIYQVNFWCEPSNDDIFLDVNYKTIHDEWLCTTHEIHLIDLVLGEY